jgi:hypothetical protein
MAVYKVIQDIEAEDKIIGWLSLKGLIYAIIAGALAFMCIRLAISGLGDAKWAVILLLFPPMLIFGILAAPIGKDQPTEVWILSHVRFFIGTHKRVWDQTGIQELVTVTVPKQIERHLTKDFTQDEVHGRLKALAATLDSRGWAVKNVTTDIYGQPGYFMNGQGDSDRLVGASSVSQPTAVLDVHAADDILDEQNNATAQNFSQLMQAEDTKRRQAVQNKMTAITNDELGDPSLYDKHPHFDTKPSLAEEQSQRLNTQKVSEGRQAVAVATTATQPPSTPAQTEATEKAQAVKIELSQSGNDLSVASIAKLANHQERIHQISANEVEILLH